MDKSLFDAPLSIEDVDELVTGKSVALVGNAASLLEKGQAHLIDRHDLVVRFNLGVPDTEHIYPLDGSKREWPAQKVGKRMDVWAGVVCPGHPRTRGPKGMLPAIDLGEWNDLLQQVWVVPFGYWWPCDALKPKVYDAARMTVQSRQEPKQLPSTTGFVIAYMLREHCSPSEIVLYGYDFFASQSWPSGMTGGGHDGGAEKRWLAEKQVEVR